MLISLLSNSSTAFLLFHSLMHFLVTWFSLTKRRQTIVNRLRLIDHRQIVFPLSIRQNSPTRRDGPPLFYLFQAPDSSSFFSFLFFFSNDLFVLIRNYEFVSSQLFDLMAQSKIAKNFFTSFPAFSSVRPSTSLSRYEISYSTCASNFSLIILFFFPFFNEYSLQLLMITISHQQLLFRGIWCVNGFFND